MSISKVGVSVIVPIFNAERFLSECVKSLLAQTLTAIEIILVIDGSTDSSKEIVHHFASVDSRVKVIDQENKGVSAARNAGIKSASGEYVAFVDADDVIKLNMMEVLYSKAMTTECDIVMSPLMKGVPKDSKEDKLPIKQLRDSYLQGVPSQKILNYYITKHGYSSPCGNLYRREIIQEFNLSFPEGITIGEDDLFNLSFFKHAHSLITLETPYYYYRTVDGSATNRYRQDLFNMYLNLDNERRKVIKEYGLPLDQTLDNFMAGRYSDCILNEILAVSHKGLNEALLQIKRIVNHPAVLQAVRGCNMNSEGMSGSRRILIPVMRTGVSSLVSFFALGIYFYKRNGAKINN